MTEFVMEVAGCVAAVRAQFDSTLAFCRQYLSQRPPELLLEVTARDLEEEARRDPQPWPAGYLELIALQRKLTEALLSRQVLLFHGSVVAVDGQAYLFTAKSGTGKSTHTALWRREFGERAQMVNDDKPFLLCREGQILACGSPWNGKHRLGENLQVPLKAICILERGSDNRIRPISAGEALPMLLQQSARPVNGANTAIYLELLDLLSRNVAFYRLQCNMEPEAARVAYAGMNP